MSRADSLSQQGLYDSALAVGQRALHRAEQRFGHRDTTVAYVLWRLGSYGHDRILDFYRPDSGVIKGWVERAIDIRREIYGRDHPEIADCLSTLADLHNVAGNHPVAESLYHESLRMRQAAYGDRHESVARSYDELAQVVKNQGRYDEAEAFYRQGLAIKQSLYTTVHYQIYRSYNELALLARHQGKYDEAIAHYRQAADILTVLSGADDPRVALALRNIARVYEHQGKFTEQEPLLLRALEIWTAAHGMNHERVAMCLIGLADVRRYQGRFRESDSLLILAEGIQNAVLKPDDLDMAYRYDTRGKLFLDQGRYVEAETSYRRAMEVWEKAFWPDNVGVAAGLHNLASICMYQGRYREAEELLNRALPLWKRQFGREHTKVSRALLDLSEVYASQHRYREAEDVCRQSLDIAGREFGTHHSRYADCRERLAEIQLARRNVVEADAGLHEVLQIRRNELGADHPAVAATMVGLAEVCEVAGDHAGAETYLRKSLGLLRRVLGDAHPDVAAVQHQLAGICVSRGNDAEAEGLLLDALRSLEQVLGPEHPDVAGVAQSLARLYGKRSDFDHSLQYYHRFIRLRQGFIEYVFPFSSETQKLRWIHKYPLLDHSLLSLALRCGEERAVTLALEMVEKGKAAVVDAVMAERRTAMCSLDNRLSGTLASHGNMCSRLANMVLAGSGELSGEAYRDSLRTMYRAVDSLEAELSRACADFEDVLASARFRTVDLVAAMPDRTVLWEYLRYVPYSFSSLEASIDDDPASRYLAFVLDDEGHTALVDLGDALLIDSLVEAVRAGVDAAAVQVHSPVAAEAEHRLADQTHSLYQLLCEPLLARSSGRSRILIAPDGILNLLPFDILAVDDSTYVVERFDISYLSCGRDLLRFSKTHAHGDYAAVLADPDYDFRDTTTMSLPLQDASGPTDGNAVYRGTTTRFSRLRFSRREGISLARAIREATNLTVDERYGSEASETYLKSLATPPTVLHLSTHGLFNREMPDSLDEVYRTPLIRSAIALAGANRVGNGGSADGHGMEDGILTAFEASGLNLLGTDLVSLSVCEAGVGDIVRGEGVFGLRRAFQHAGARSILMSLWNVPDRETSLLIERFYEEWLGGTSRRAALRTASLAVLQQVRDQRGCGHPLFWGGFILVGDPE